MVRHEDFVGFVGTSSMTNDRVYRRTGAMRSNSSSYAMLTWYKIIHKAATIDDINAYRDIKPAIAHILIDSIDILVNDIP